MRSTNLTNPANWSTREEDRVISAYLNIRATFRTSSASPMTDAHNRANRTRQYLLDGIISNQRYSFQYVQSNVASRSAINTTVNSINPPNSYEETDYPDITPFWSV